MRSRRAQAYAGIALGSLGLGTILWALRRKDPPAAEGFGSPADRARLPPSDSAGAPAPNGAEGGSAALDRNIVLLLDRTVPGTLQSFDLLREWVIKDGAAVAGTARIYQQRYAAWLGEQVQQGLISQGRAKEASGILDGLGLASTVVSAAATAVGSAVSSFAGIPGVGAIIQGLYNIVKIFGEAAAEAARQGKSLFSPSRITVAGAPIFSGWKDSSYYCWDVPVWSFTSPMWLSLFRASGASPAFEPLWQSFLALATTLPFGPRVARVELQNDGSYFYKFNIRGNGDLSAEAESRREIRGFQVWNPADISPSGPRGFDPANPLAWKRPGMKASVFDPVPASFSEPPGSLPAGAPPPGGPPPGAPPP